MSLSFTHPLLLLLLLGLVPLALYWNRRTTSLTPRRSRGALWLRSLSISALILAIAGASVVELNRDLTVVFLLDRSLSTGGDSLKWQRDFIEKALTSRGVKDKFGIVLFGEETRSELRPALHERTELRPFTAVVDRSSSRLTNALRIASTNFGGRTARRLVLLSDGQNTEAHAESEAEALAAAGIELWTVPLPTDRTPDLLLSRLKAPDQIAVDEPFVLRVVVESSGIKEADLIISLNGQAQRARKLRLKKGPNLFLIPQRVSVAGPIRFEARVVSSLDSRQENNKGESLSIVGGEQTILVLRSEAGPGSLVPPLRAAGLKVQAVTPATLPTRVGAWRDVATLIIEDVNSLDWDTRLQKVVSLLVRDGGMGLLMLGSNQTFGVGGYTHSPIEPLLPVNLAIRRPKDQPLAALIQLLDKSGSMGGVPIQMAREAAIAAGETLSERDLLGVVGFDSAARWVYPFQKKGDGDDFLKAVSGLRAGGGTDLYPALDEALDEIVPAKAPMKHLIVLSDGAVAPGAYDKLLARAVKANVTVSAVALGSGADMKFLRHLTSKGKGRLYQAGEAQAGAPLPQIFVRETLLATGAGVKEEPTKVITTGQGQGANLLSNLAIDAAPELQGYALTSSKGGSSRVLLETKKRDPILATGRAGLGFTAAWTSDLGGKWAADWLKTAGPSSQSTLLDSVLLRTIRKITPAGNLSERSRGNFLETQSLGRGDMASVRVKLSTRAPLAGPVKAVVIAADGESKELVLQPDGPYKASGLTYLNKPGSALVLAQDLDGQLLARTNLSVPLSPEFSRLGTDLETLKALSRQKGGRFEPKPQDIFSPPSEPTPIRTPLGHDLARGALLLLMLEIAVRRLPIPKKLSEAGKTVKEAPVDSLQSRFAQLRANKKESREKTSSTRLKDLKKLKVARMMKSAAKEQASTESTPKPKPSQPAPKESNTESTLSRLKKVKKKKRDETSG